MSKGHSIILPLEHIKTDKLPKQALSLAHRIAKKIKTKLNPEDVKIETSNFQGHSLINIVPFYKNKKPEKTKASEEELKELQQLLSIKKRKPNAVNLDKKKSTSSEKLPKISFRIP